jgi:hypothetical protein
MSDDQEATPVAVDTDAYDTYMSYLNAKKARARWADEEKRLRTRLLATLGYAEDDENPTPAVATGPDGKPLFKVTIGQWRGLDFNALRNNYPDVYAACETSKPTQAIKPV